MRRVIRRALVEGDNEELAELLDDALDRWRQEHAHQRLLGAFYVFVLGIDVSFSLPLNIGIAFEY